MLSTEIIITYLKDFKIKDISSETGLDIMSISHAIKGTRDTKISTFQLLSDFCIKDFESRKKIIQGK